VSSQDADSKDEIIVASDYVSSFSSSPSSEEGADSDQKGNSVPLCIH
jgi:hypothetical protein